MIEIIYWTIFIIAVSYAVILMNRVRNTVQSGNKDTNSLTKKEKMHVIALVLLAPIAAGAIFYYGWMKRLPKKSEEAKKYNIIAFGIVMVIFFILGGRIS